MSRAVKKKVHRVVMEEGRVVNATLEACPAELVGRFCHMSELPTDKEVSHLLAKVSLLN